MPPMDRCRRSTRCRRSRCESIELLRVPMPLRCPLRTAAGRADATGTCSSCTCAAARRRAGRSARSSRSPPTRPEFTDAGACLALRDHLRAASACGGPDRRRRCALGDASSPRSAATRWRERPCELAVLDAQLRAADRSLARDWLGATATAVPAGAALGLHDDLDDLLAEADAALAAGAARLRVKIGPGPRRRAAAGAARPRRRGRRSSRPTPTAPSRGRPGARRTSTASASPASSSRSPPTTSLGHARLAARLDTPICLDEPLTSLGAIEAAVALGACEVVCLKPAASAAGSPPARCTTAAPSSACRCGSAGCSRPAIGRAANLAVAALPHMALPPDLDPRGRFDPDLADPRLPVDGVVPVPDRARHRARPRRRGAAGGRGRGSLVP